MGTQVRWRRTPKRCGAESHRCRGFAVEMIGQRVWVSALCTRGTEVSLTEPECRRTSQFGVPSDAGG